MTELRFHKRLYSGDAVDAAWRRVEMFGTFETAEEADYWLVRVRAKNRAQQARLEGELCNYALGLTAERGGP